MSGRARTLALAALWVMPGPAGCTRYRARPIDQASRAHDLEQRRLDDPGLAEFVRQFSRQPPGTWPPPAWGLAQLTMAALYFHPDLDVFRARWGVATAGRRSAAQSPNPTVDVVPGYNQTTRSPSPWIVTSFLTVSIETGGRRGARRDQADARADVARLELASAAWEVRRRVRHSLEELRAAAAELELLHDKLALLEENTERVEQRHSAGAASAFEQLQSRLALQQVRVVVRDGERRVAQARLALAGAIAVPPEALDDVALSFDELEGAVAEPLLADTRARALTNRADLLAALADYAASEASVRLAVAEQYPELSIGLGYEYDQGDNKWSLGIVSLTLPILHRNRGPIAEAEARRVEMAARFDALQLRVIESVARARLAYESAGKKKADTEAVRGDAEAQLRRAEARRAAGDISAADVVTARLELNAALLAEASATSELHQALGELENAVQRPLAMAPAAWETAPERAGSGRD